MKKKKKITKRGLQYQEIVKIEKDATGDAPYGHDLAQVTFGKNVLTLKNKGWSKGQYETVSLVKRSTQVFGDSLSIRSWEKKLVKDGTQKKKCSLGHEHDVPIEKVFTWNSAEVTIPWEQVEAMIEWLNTGFWRRPKESQMTKVLCGDCNHPSFIPKHHCKDGSRR